MLLEIQQNSNITYRVNDYKRKGKDGRERELHIEKALDVLRLVPQTVQCSCDLEWLIRNCLFGLKKIEIRDSVQYHSSLLSFSALTLVEGDASITYQGESISIKKGETVFLGTGMDNILIEGNGTFLSSEL